MMIPTRGFRQGDGRSLNDRAHIIETGTDSLFDQLQAFSYVSQHVERFRRGCVGSVYPA